MDKCLKGKFYSSTSISNNFFTDIRVIINFIDRQAVGHNPNTSKINLDIMQFIALKDKDDNIIHFGDILIDEQNNLLTPVIEISNNEHTLFFKPIHHLNNNMPIGCKSTYSHTLKIVGDIFHLKDFIEKLENGSIKANNADILHLFQML